MKVKTYGVPGLSEWYGKVKAGNIEVEVQFKGGTASPSGAQPAYFVTKDPITQFVIENSKQFKQGFIILVMQHELPGEHPRIAAPKQKPVVQKPVVPNDEVPKEEVPQEDENPEGNEPADEPAEIQGADNDEAAGEGEEVADGLTRINVASLDETKAYLVDNYGCKSSDLRSKPKIVAAAKERGIEFIGI